MSGDPRLRLLLKEWAVARGEGRTESPEQLCDRHRCPELVSELRHRIDDSHATNPMLDQGITSPGSPTPQEFGLADQVGELVVEGYEIIRELGRGSMGIVYQAYDRTRKRMVALKTLQRRDATGLYRFKNEFRALADISHPNLVALHELISDGRTWFFTMDLLEGNNFLAYVYSGPAGARTEKGGTSPRSPEQVGLTPVQLTRLREALLQLAEGVVALHEAGKLHRDIKPTNVLVKRDGGVVLLDFGLAANLDRTGLHHSAEEHILGTVAYMAPEQAASLPVSPASDWYSVGVMLYKALTGQLPFRGNALKILMDKQQLDPPVPSTLVRDVPEDLDKLCMELMCRRPEGRPEGQEVLRRLGKAPTRQAPHTLAPSQVQVVPFVGRKGHLDTLQDAFQATRRGRAIAIYVHGKSGLGKSALVQRFLDGLSEHDDAVILVGRCYESESVPYKALDSLMDNLGQYLRRLPRPEVEAILPRDIGALTRVFPVLSSVEAVAEAPGQASEIPDRQEQRRRAFAALRELLGRLGDRKTLVLFIDDLQWGDSDSAALLGELLRPPDNPVFLLVGCYRSEDRLTSPLLQILLKPAERTAEPPRFRELAVEALSAEETQELAQTLLGRTDLTALTQARTVAEESRGSPFFVYHLVQHLQTETEPGQFSSGAGEISLDEVLWDRIQRLPDEARRLLEVVAIAGRPLGREAAYRAAALGLAERGTLNLLRAGRLVRTTGASSQEDVETYHDRIREAVVARLPGAVRKTFHHRLATTLEALGASDPETLAVYYQGAEENDKAGRYFAEAAGKAAAALAFDHAAKLYRLAIELRPVEAAEARDLRTKLGDALANAGRGPEAAREYQIAAEEAGAAAAIELERRAAYQYLISGHFDAGCAALDGVLRTVGMRLPATPWRALLSLLLRRGWLRLRGLGFRHRHVSQIAPEQLARLDICWSASIGLGVIDIIRAADFQTRTLHLALRAGEPGRIIRALALEAIHTAAGGGRTSKRTAHLLQVAAALMEQLDEPYSRGIVLLARGATAWLEGRYTSARQFLQESESIFQSRCTGVAWEIGTAQTYLLVSLVSLGEIAELARLGPALLAEAQERGDLYRATNVSAYAMPFVLLGADDPDGARQTVRQALGRWSQQGFHIQHLMALITETEIDLYRGDGTAAWRRLQQQWPAYARSQLMHVQHAHIQALYSRGRSALAAGIAQAAPDLLRAAEQNAFRLERQKMPWSCALASLLRAGLSMVGGKPGLARDRLAAALESLDRLETRLHAAATRRCLGHLLGGDQGRQLIQQADTWMAAQAIRAPARMTAALLPGFPN